MIATLVNVLPLVLVGATVALGHVPYSWCFLLGISCSKIGEETIKPIRSALLNRHIEGSAHRATIISWSAFVGASLGTVTTALLLMATHARESFQVYVLLLGTVAVISGLLSIPLYSTFDRRIGHAQHTTIVHRNLA